MATDTKQKLPISYKPVGMALGYAGGAVSGMLFRRTWKLLRHEENTPDALDRDRRWGEILLAAALQGAIVAMVRSIVDRAGAKAVERSTGAWPVDRKGSA